MRKIAGYKFQRRHRDTHTQIDTHRDTHTDRECASHIALATRTWASATRIRIELANVYGIPIGHRARAEMLPLSGFFFLSWCNKYLIPCRQLVLQTMINRKSSRLRATENERERALLMKRDSACLLASLSGNYGQAWATHLQYFCRLSHSSWTHLLIAFSYSYSRTLGIILNTSRSVSSRPHTIQTN